jgi:hypothetical protein
MRVPSHLRAACLGLLLVLAPAGTLRAADLYFIMFAETLDPNIGMVQNLATAKTWARSVAQTTGLTLHLQTLMSTALTPANARDMLNAINPGEDDVVYFIYSGHGYNAGDSEWPTFAFLTYTGDPYVSFDEVVATLQPKAQRLLVVLADCCNVLEEDAGRDLPRSESSGPSALTTANVQRLFLDFRGTILASGASKGQYGLANDFYGGVFMTAFQNAFDTLTSTMSPATWEDILAQAQTDTHAVALVCAQSMDLNGTEPQTPQYIISTEQVAGDNPEVPADDTNDGADDGTDDRTDDGDGDSGDTGETQVTTQPLTPGCGTTGLMSLAVTSFWWLVRVRRH